MTSDRGDVRASKALGTGARWVTGVLAALLLAAGGAGVFLTENEIGTGVLLAAGALFTSVSVLGHWPRLRVGDSEFDPAVYRISRAEGVADGARLVREAVEDEAGKEPERQHEERPQREAPQNKSVQPGSRVRLEAARAGLGSSPLLQAARDAERLARAQNLVMTHFHGDESRLTEALELIGTLDEQDRRSR